MSKKATNENREHIDESDDESKIDWSGLGDAWMIEYQKLLKKHGLPLEDEGGGRNIMNVEFSQQANLYLDEYKNALVEKYGRSEERANELKQQMDGEIRAKAFNAN